jgi:non-ribosomal peptide synthetase component F
VALAGGEALPPSLAADLRGRVRRLINVYGPTETTIWSTLDDVTDPSAGVTIGRPIANTTVYVLDERERELWIGGAGVARGYLGRPDLTAQRFRPNPFACSGAGSVLGEERSDAGEAEPQGPRSPRERSERQLHSRLYRTGDLVRYRPDGRLEFLGRIDDQVKIRGHRVEPGEIEARLLEHPAVAQAAVVVQPAPDGEPALVGYVAPRTTAAGDLRAHLAASLPAAMPP